MSGFNLNNNSIDYNTTKIYKNDWHLNFKGAINHSKTDSAIAKGNESDGTKNYQFNLNGNKWLNDNLKFKSMFYYRDTKSAYDSSATKEDLSHQIIKCMHSKLASKGKRKNLLIILCFIIIIMIENIMFRVRKTNTIVVISFKIRTRRGF